MANSSFLEFFKSMDSFGEGIELNFRGQTRFSSLCGSLITIFLYVTFFLYAL